MCRNNLLLTQLGTFVIPKIEKRSPHCDGVGIVNLTAKTPKIGDT